MGRFHRIYLFSCPVTGFCVACRSWCQAVVQGYPACTRMQYLCVCPANLSRDFKFTRQRVALWAGLLQVPLSLHPCGTSPCTSLTPPKVPATHALFPRYRLALGHQTCLRQDWWQWFVLVGVLPPSESMTGYVPIGVSPTFRAHCCSLVQAR